MLLRRSRYRRSTLVVVSLLTLAGIALTGSGCPLSDLLRPRTPTPIPTPAPTPGPVQITVLPMYRLIVSNVLADAPSRLVALYVRVYAKDATQVNVSANDLSLALRGGEPARVFDRARAVELLHRTTLGDAELSYLQEGSAPSPGGLAGYSQSDVRATVLSRLFTDTLLSASNSPVEGYVIVDTYQALPSLTGASMTISARGNDGSFVQATYEIVPPSPRTAEPAAGAPEPEATAVAPQPEPTAGAPQPQATAVAPQPEPTAVVPQPTPAAPQPEPTAGAPQPEAPAAPPAEPTAGAPPAEPPAAATPAGSPVS